MTYVAKETSALEGQPVELYEFRYHTTVLRYSTGEDVYIDASLDEWTPNPILRGEVGANTTANVAEIKISVPKDEAVAALFVGFMPGKQISLTIKRAHLTDGGTPEVITYWKGRVRGVEWVNSFAEMTCEPITHVLSRDGLRRHFSSMCPHMLFSPACGIAGEVFGETLLGSEITGLSGNTLTGAIFQSTFADGYLDGGYVIKNGLDFRMIVSNVTTTVTLLLPFDSKEDADSFQFFPGCDRSYDECDTKYSNSDNYGGFNYIPGVNPFESGLDG